MAFKKTLAVTALLAGVQAQSAEAVEEEPVWYNFIVNDDLATWAVVATYDEGFEAFYLWTPADDVCLLTPDWKTDDKDDNIWGFFVSETEEGPCSFIEEQGWTYASYTYDEESDMQEPISITGPWGNEWIFKEEEEFASEYPSYADEFGQIMYGADTYTTNTTSTGEEEPVWYNFIVNDDLATWAVIATYDEEFEAFYLWTPADEVCLLTPDWKTDDRADNIWGFFVSETAEGPCPFIEEQGWTYAWYTYDNQSDTQDPISITGPWGNEWDFLGAEDFASEYPSYYEEFNTIMYVQSNGEEEPIWYNFITNDDMETWAVIATYDEEFEAFYLWTPTDEVCLLTPDWKTDDKDDNIWGFFVNETAEAPCPFIEEQGWTYAWYTYDEESDMQEPISITGPWGNEWDFLEAEEFASEYPSYYQEFNTVMYGQPTGEEEPVWYNFITNDDLATWAVIATYDEEMESFYLWTPDEDVCLLTPDWKTDNKADNIWGFFVNETAEGPCRFIQEQNWTYASYTYDNQSDLQEPISVTGPWGNEWIFTSPEDFESQYPSWFNDFNTILYGNASSPDMCMSDESYADDYGDGCDWYTANTESCGTFDDNSAEGETAFDACCACGRSSSDSDDWEVCMDDEEYTDDDGDTCASFYDGNPSGCGQYDSNSAEGETAFDACCACSGNATSGDSDDSDEEVFFEAYVVDPNGSGDYAYIWFEDSNMTEMFYWNDEDSAYCVLTPDWKNSSDQDEGIWGFYVSDPYEMCPYVEENGWTYSWYSETETDASMQSPNGDMWQIVDEETYYMYYYAEDDQDWYYDDDMEEDDRDTYVDEQKGAIMDHLWYGVDSYGDQAAETCSLNSQCGDNGLTQCCVQVMTTDESGMTEQFFRCMNRGLVELDTSGSQEWISGPGESMSFTMKCMEQGSIYIKTGLVAIASFAAFVAM